ARGAATALWHEAALGLLDRLHARLDDGAEGGAGDEIAVTNACWHACAQGQLAAARLLAAHGADPSWVGWMGKAPLDLAAEGGHAELEAGLPSIGASAA